ncbi:MAG: DUF4224 domain-containing protein [Salinisphaeraceae bacterium]
MAILTHEDLQAMTGKRNRDAMRRALRAAGIPFREVGGRLVTTEDAITAVLAGKARPKTGPRFDALTQERPG